MRRAFRYWESYSIRGLFRYPRNSTGNSKRKSRRRESKEVAEQIVKEAPYRTSLTVPFMDLISEHQGLRGELRQIWDSLLDSAAFVRGPQVDQFERSFAEFCEVKHAIGVANGTDGLVLALKALGIGHGDEVIVPANSFVATAEAVVHTGATPVFVDIDPRTYNIAASQIERHLTWQTTAIIPVHLYGQPADMDAVLAIAERHSLKVIEDSAQARGARYRGRRAGSMGDAACFSFYPAKNLGACGDGGAVVTNDDNIATAVRRLRDHGGLKKYEHYSIGYNSRLDTLQAAILQRKLRDLGRRNEMRRRHAEAYNELLASVSGIVTPFVPDGIGSVHHLYVVRVERGNRSDLQRYLQERGVQTGIHYPVPIHRTPAFARFNVRACPVAEQYSATILSLPMFPDMEERQLEYVAKLVSDYMECI